MTNRLCFALSALLVGLSAPLAHAATIASEPALVVPDPGDGSFQFQLILSPGQDEVSIFEGVFDITGLEFVSNLQVTGSSAEWDSSVYNPAPDVGSSPSRMSLTSNNRAGDRVLATYSGIWNGPGELSIFLGSPTFAASDISEFPFTMDVPITTAVGTRLATVPEPASILLIGAALAGLSVLRRNGSLRGS